MIYHALDDIESHILDEFHVLVLLPRVILLIG